MKPLTADHLFRVICILFTINTIAFSCADRTSDMPHDELSGEWRLISFECCDLPKEEYDYNDIVWEFEENKNEVTFIHITEFDKNSEYGFQTEGTYRFALSDNVLTIFYHNRNEKLEISFSDNSMALSHNPESDGTIMKFKK